MKRVLTSVIFVLAVFSAAGSPRAQTQSEPYRAKVDSDGVHFFKPSHIIVFKSHRERGMEGVLVVVD